MSKLTNDLKDGTGCMGCSDVRGPGYLARPGSWDLNEEGYSQERPDRANAEAEAAMLPMGSKGKQN